MAAPAVQERPKDTTLPARAEAPRKPRQIVILTVKPGYSIHLDHPQDEYRQVLFNGKMVDEKKKAKAGRFGSSVAHILRVDDGPDMQQVREAAGYGFKFIEACPHSGIPRGHMSLWEMKKKDREAYWGKLNEIEYVGHKKQLAQKLDSLIEEWYAEAVKYDLETKALRQEA